ncbi:TauD/TfdA family dioxygenase [Streptomyces sp. HUAS MG91]|uniref:TauD/TfdA family dioxygenase n=1 Tax=Streptomyces tabacisoli TaxID=3156398 RepID=A0AAU8J599_9ACTN
MTPPPPPGLPRRPCAGPAVWQGSEPTGWSVELSQDHRAELDTALRAVRARATPLLKVTTAEAALPLLAAELTYAADELEHGRGFVLLRRLPVQRRSEADAALLLWMVGQHLGVPVSQNTSGHMIGRLRDDPRDRSRRAFHTDPADVLALLCPGPDGSRRSVSLTSSAAVHNAVLSRRPDLFDGLGRTRFIDRRGEQPPGRLPWQAVRLAHRDGNRLSVRYDRDRLESARRFAHLPRPTAHDRELFDLIDSTASSPAFRLDVDLSPGDLLLLNNHAVLHSHAAPPSPSPPSPPRGRLVRLWLTPRRPRPLPVGFWGQEPSLAGGRGGVAPRDVITAHTPTTVTAPHTPTTPRSPHDRPVHAPGAVRPVTS